MKKKKLTSSPKLLSSIVEAEAGAGSEFIQSLFVEVFIELADGGGVGGILILLVFSVACCCSSGGGRRGLECRDFDSGGGSKLYVW